MARSVKSLDMPKLKNTEAEQHASQTPIGKAALQELGEWIAEGRLPEVIPTRQERSLRSTLAMLEAGRMLLLDRSLEELSIEMVCERASTTVGTFYGRFENKQAFFVTMQRMQLIRSEAALNELADQHENASLETLCRDMVIYMVGVFRSHFGVLRASLQHTREGMYDIHKSAGDRNRPVFTAALSPHLGHLAPRQRKLRIHFAYQVVAGTLVHVALNNPGPLKLDDDALVDELARMVLAYLHVES
jgi:AcrR family transcriptional regulator